MVNQKKEIREKINKLVASYGIAKNADLVDWLVNLFDEYKLEVREEIIKEIKNRPPKWTLKDKKLCVHCKKRLVVPSKKNLCFVCHGHGWGKKV